MERSVQTIKWNLAGSAGSIINHLSYPLQKDNGKVLIFDTSIDTDNLGDFIIMRYCGNILHSVFENDQFVHVPTHTVPSDEQETAAKSIKYKFVCGTNLLTSHIEEWWNWRLPDGMPFYCLYEAMIRGSFMKQEDIYKSICVLRKYSIAPKYSKIGGKADEIVYKLISEMQESSASPLPQKKIRDEIID